MPMNRTFAAVIFALVSSVANAEGLIDETCHLGTGHAWACADGRTIDWPSTLQQITITGTTSGTTTITSIRRPGCDADYVLLSDSAGNPVCARDFKEPIR
jgi:hypothetical protein